MAVNPDIDPSSITNDPIVNNVVELIVKRHVQGMEKFGRTMEANNRPMDEWVNETIEELLDAIHYLTKMKSMFKKFDVDKAKVKGALQSLEKESTHENKEAS